MWYGIEHVRQRRYSFKYITISVGLGNVLLCNLTVCPQRINPCCKPLAFHQCQPDWTPKGYVWFVRVSKVPKSRKFCWDCWQKKIAFRHQIESKSHIVITFLALLFQFIQNVLLSWYPQPDGHSSTLNQLLYLIVPKALRSASVYHGLDLHCHHKPLKKWTVRKINFTHITAQQCDTYLCPTTR